MEFLFGVVVGVIIGWHFPTPAWAQSMIDKVKGMFKK